MKIAFNSILKKFGVQYIGEMFKEDEPHILLSAEDIKKYVISKFDAFIFDMDGVLWIVDTPIPGAAEALAYLRQQNKGIFFVTNNSLLRSHEYAEKIARLGLGDFPCDTIFCSSQAVALYLQHQRYKGKVFLIGPISLREELSRLPDIQIVESDECDNVISPQKMANVDVDFSIGAVVMGFDPKFNYYKLAYATAILNKNPDAIFVYTNGDKKFPTQRLVLPGTGAFVAALETATERKGIAAGKPGPVIINEIIRRFPLLTTNRICVIGDNLLTDIVFGRVNGLGTILVETGVHKREDIKKCYHIDTLAQYDTIKPDFVIPSVAGLNINGKAV